MRRIVSLLLSFVLIFILTACGQSAISEKRKETQPAVQKTEEQFETSQNGVGAEAEKQETEAQPDTEMETEPSESISTGEQEADLAYYTNGRTDQEQNDPDARPAISGGVENMDAYDTIILGYPIWHGQAPRIISTFLESYDFSGKTMIPFCTSHSSGIGSSADDLHILCADSAVWLDGRRFEAGTSKEIIEEWIWSVKGD